MLGAATPAMTVVARATASPVLSPGQLADRNDMFSHVGPVGRFAWFGGTGTTAYADRTHQLTGILLAQVGPATPDAQRAMNDFWITLYQAID
jgi:CubicO group peptidase (beta-lactamase class C family)